MSARKLVPIAVVAAALAPVVVRAPDTLSSMTHALALLLGAIALNLAMGYAGQPSLGHGAFMGIGAFGYAVLRARAGWGPVPSMLVAVILAVAAGIVVARGVSRLRAAFVALATWVVAWAVWLALGSFPTLTGGSAGLVVPLARVNMRVLGLAFPVGPAVLFETALVAVVVFVLAMVSALRRYRPVLAAQREDPAAAVAAGVGVVRMRAVALVASAAAAGFAGVLVAQVAGVADPTTFRPLLSIELFLAVLLGGAGELLGPPVGLVSLLVVSAAADAGGRAFDVSGQRLEPLAAAVLLGLVLAVGRRGIVPLVREKIRRPTAPIDRVPRDAEFSEPASGARIEARAVSVSFGGIRALDRVTFAADPGMCHALIGPNGSGKTTLLRVLAGALEPDAGAVELDGHLLDPGPEERAHAGVVRTLQRLALAPDMSAIDHVVSGMEPARAVGFLPAIARTPNARAEEQEVVHRARAILGSLDLEHAEAKRAEELDAGERRLVQLARALAAKPRVILLDEPSAGLDMHGTRRVLVTLSRAKANGVSVVLVAHDLWLVRAIADRVTVLDAGRVIAEGTPDEIAADPEVQSAYLGD